MSSKYVLNKYWSHPSGKLDAPNIKTQTNRGRVKLIIYFKKNVKKLLEQK
jgi:hypothetical protein